MSRPLLILGTSGNALDILDVVEAVNAIKPTWSVVGFLDDARETGSEHLGLPILGRLSEAGRFEAMSINAIGSDRSFRHREQFVATTGLGPERFATLVHPGACVSSRARLGRGVCVNFGASVAGNVHIGDQVSIGPGCIIGHDTVIDSYTVLAPGAVVSGAVRIGASCYLGARAVVRQKVRIGDGALIGMGAVVLHDVEPETTVVGVPARTLERTTT